MRFFKNNIFKFIFTGILLLFFCCKNSHPNQKPTSHSFQINKEWESAAQKFSQTISLIELKNYVYNIASEKFGGRKAGTKGHDSLCDYLANTYNQMDVKAGGLNGSYFQTINKGELPLIKENTSQVLAKIVGSLYPDEIILLTAHSDHLGKTKKDIYYGADDNGSGTAALLEIAQAFSLASKNGFQPKRTILFIHITAEEQGLLGSQYYIDNPIYPLQKTLVNLNIDMIGRVDKKHQKDSNYIYLIGADRINKKLDALIKFVNQKESPLQLDETYNQKNDPNRYYYRSDHYNFAKKNIPVAFFFSGVHKDYHRPTDTPKKLNYAAFEKRVKLIFNVVWYMSFLEDPLK